MARLEGVDIPDNKRAEISLTYLYGIGFTRARSLLYRAGIDFGKRMGDLNDREITALRKLIEEEGGVEGDLRKEVQLNIRRLMEIGCYRGLRHRRGLPVRGQRTHTNARSRKGPRRGQIANKRKASK
ncbi:MAG: 30S ribosomal protein S13 [Bryobacterales bacterium]|nr:30S ribosomal protein S13 [Bryobacterales bacterium]